LALRYATNSAKSATGSVGRVSRKTSTRAAAATGTRSLAGSKGIFWYSCGLIDETPAELIRKV
jgi:hypothetical protein